MGRYLVLYAACVRFSLQRAMEFRLDFFFRVFMDGLWYAMNLAFFEILHNHTPLLGGWDQGQVRVFAAGVFVADALHMTFFSNNAWQFPMAVNRGDLDYHLLRPVSSLFFLSMREFAVNSFLNLLMALGILAWALTSYPGEIEAWRLALYAGALVVGALLHYTVMFLFLVPVFWLQGSSGLREVFWTSDRFVGRPDGLFRGWVRHLLLSLLPFALVVSYPTRALFEPDPWPKMLHLALVTAVMFALLQFAWRKGLRAYSSASS
jgi:ABC-2 type transport system permease protein